MENRRLCLRALCFLLITGILAACGAAAEKWPLGPDGKPIGDGTAEAQACDAVSIVQMKISQWPGPDVNDDGGGDAIAVRNWKKSLVTPQGVLAGWAMNDMDYLKDRNFVSLITNYNEQAARVTTQSNSSLVTSPSISDELRNQCMKKNIQLPS